MLFAHTLIKHCDPVRMLKDSCASIHVKCRRIHPPMGVWVSAGPVSLSDLWWTSLCTPDAWRYDDCPDVGALLFHLPLCTSGPQRLLLLLCLYALSLWRASSCLNTATCWSDSCQTASVLNHVWFVSVVMNWRLISRAVHNMFIRAYLVIIIYYSTLQKCCCLWYSSSSGSSSSVALLIKDLVDLC